MPKHKVLTFPGSLFSDVKNAPEEKQPEVAARKLAESFSLFAASGLPNHSTRGVYSIDVTFRFYGNTVVGNFYAYLLDHAKAYIDNLKRIADKFKPSMELRACA